MRDWLGRHVGTWSESLKVCFFFFFFRRQSLRKRMIQPIRGRIASGLSMREIQLVCERFGDGSRNVIIQPAQTQISASWK